MRIGNLTINMVERSVVKYLILSLLTLLILAVASVGYTVWRSFKLPEDHPEIFAPIAEQKILACLGDSITHGHVGQGYIKQVSTALAKHDVAVMNAGINGDLAYNLYQRLDAVIAHRPDFVSVMIGTNDANGSLNEAKEQMYMEMKGLPQAPELDFYREFLTKIVKRLKSETNAKVAILSLPVLGEDLNSKANRAIQKHNTVIKEIALNEQVTYLPLNEAQVAVLETEAIPEALRLSDSDARNSLAKAQFSHYILQRSWDEVAAGNNLVLTTETIHMSDRGAAMIAEQILGFVTPHAISMP